MSTCPNGHQSAAADYCDTCGAPMGGASAAPAAPLAPEVAAGDCPHCGAVKVAGEKFCEVCGLDFDSGKLPEPPVVSPATVAPVTAAPVALAPETGWTAILNCDRDWWEHNAGAGGVADGVPYPDPEPAERRVALRSASVVVGRTSGSSVADVDCGSVDTGVSRRHAQLRRGGDGTWTVTDLGSTNGTFLDGSDDRLAPQAQTALGAGQRIRIGAFTVVTLAEAAPGED